MTFPHPDHLVVLLASVTALSILPSCLRKAWSCWPRQGPALRLLGCAAAAVMFTAGLIVAWPAGVHLGQILLANEVEWQQPLTASDLICVLLGAFLFYVFTFKFATWAVRDLAQAIKELEDRRKRA